MTDAELADIRARADAATAGEWAVDDVLNDLCAHVTGPQGSAMEPNEGGGYFYRADAAFIAAARSDVPALLAEIDRLRAALAAQETTDG